MNFVIHFNQTTSRLCLSASLSKRTFAQLLLQNDYGLHKCLIEVQNLSSHLDSTHSHASLLVLSSQCFRTPSNRKVKTPI
uniref:Uncharacterized protein n=1 Tax=Populus trichocarpa TaxID=3694 RepID=U5GJF9_POPTR